MNDDESYRTCTICGRDCEPDPMVVDGVGMRIGFVCPIHGLHTVVAPFDLDG